MRAGMAVPTCGRIVRVMVTAEEDQLGLAALKAGYEKLQRVYAEEAEKFLFFNKMHAPVKRIQNKFRYQVLMRLTDGSPLPRIYEIAAEENTKEVLVYVEENPGNLS